MSDETWARVEERRQTKQKVLNATTRFQKRQAQDFYTRMDREVKKNCKKDKRAYTEHLAKEAETACGKGDIKSLYNITRQLSGRPPITNSPVKDSNGNVISKIEVLGIVLKRLITLISLQREVCHSIVYSTIILRVAIWSTRERSCLNPACSSLKVLSTSVYILCNMTLHRILLGIDKSVIPLQLLQRDRSPF
jgi:hypothetical protein